MGKILKADFRPRKKAKRANKSMAEPKRVTKLLGMPNAIIGTEPQVNERIERGVIVVGATEVIKPKPSFDWFSLIFWIVFFTLLGWMLT